MGFKLNALGISLSKYLKNQTNFTSTQLNSCNYYSFGYL